MYTLHNFKPSFATPTDNCADIEDTIPLGTVKDPQETLATVMLTRLHDPRMQNRFHRLTLVDAEGKVSGTYPLNRKINHVGRSRRNNVRIDDPLVSIRHLSISVSADKCLVNDLESSNGTFINGERLEGGRMLNDGDEILIGKTVLRFAARQQDAAIPSVQAHKASPARKKFNLLVIGVVTLVFGAAIAINSTPRGSDFFGAKEISSAGKTHASSPSTEANRAAAPRLPVQAGGAEDLHHQQLQTMRPSYIQQALADYAAGRIDSAAQTLRMLSVARGQTAEAFQARQMIALLSTVRQLHAQALEARKQKQFAEAIDCWDRLLTVDMELVGDRPSYFARQAELQVITLTYEYAVEAFHSKNYQKVRQLCRAILQIDPKNQKALALLAKIDPKA